MRYKVEVQQGPCCGENEVAFSLAGLFVWGNIAPSILTVPAAYHLQPKPSLAIDEL